MPLYLRSTILPPQDLKKSNEWSCEGLEYRLRQSTDFAEQYPIARSSHRRADCNVPHIDCLPGNLRLRLPPFIMSGLASYRLFYLTLSARANRRAAAGVATAGVYCLQRRETEFVWRVRLSSKREPVEDLSRLLGPAQGPGPQGPRPGDQPGRDLRPAGPQRLGQDDDDQAAAGPAVSDRRPGAGLRQRRHRRQQERADRLPARRVVSVPVPQRRGDARLLRPAVRHVRTTRCKQRDRRA